MVDLIRDGVTIAPTLAAEGANLSDGATHGRIELAVLNLLTQE